VEGTMLWFNLDKGYGFVQTEEDERLYVAGSGFLPGHEPRSRCKGRAVTFERQEREGDTRAINLAFVTNPEPRRARLRHVRGGSSL
jgi:cold shock CspA family protein